MKELVEAEKVEPDFDRFELYIEVFTQGKSRTIQVAFKIIFDPEVLIFCKAREPVFFDNEYSDQNLQP